MKGARASARCVSCGAEIERWRERFTPLRSGIPVQTADGAFAVQTFAPGACPCGEGMIEIRVEPEPQSS